MTNTPHPGETGQPSPQTSGTKFWDDITSAGLRRDRSRQWFAGVCAGIARRVDVDPVLIRAAFIALTLFGGIGIPLYLVAWLFLPDESGRILARDALSGGNASNAGAIVLVIVTVLALAAIVTGGDGFFIGWGVIPLAIIAWLFWRHQQRPGNGSAQWTSTDHATTTAAPGPTSPMGPQADGHSSYAASAAAAPAAPFTAGTSAPTAPFAAGTSTPAATFAAGTSTPAAPFAAGTSAPTAPFAAGTSAPTAPFGSAPPSAHMAPSAPPVPPRAHLPLAPPPPPRPRRRSAGFAGFLLTLGVAVVGYSLGYLVADPVGFSGTAETFGLIIGLGAAALTTLIMGLTGRRSLLSATLVAILGLSAIGAGVGERVWDGDRGIRTWTPTLSSTTTVFEHGAGESTLDLRPLFAALAVPPATPQPSPTPATAPTPGATPAPSASPSVNVAPNATPAVPQRIEVEQGAGEVIILVPPGASAQIRAKSAFGEVDVEGDLPRGFSDRRDGNNDGPSETRTLTLGSGTPAVIVNAELTFGQITIKEG